MFSFNQVHNRVVVRLDVSAHHSIGDVKSKLQTILDTDAESMRLFAWERPEPPFELADDVHLYELTHGDMFFLAQCSDKTIAACGVCTKQAHALALFCRR